MTTLSLQSGGRIQLRDADARESVNSYFLLVKRNFASAAVFALEMVGMNLFHNTFQICNIRDRLPNRLERSRERQSETHISATR